MPLSLRWGSVTAVSERLDELIRLEVDGVPCIAYPRLTGPVEPGDVVLVNAPAGGGEPAAVEVLYANLTRGIGLPPVEGSDGIALPWTPAQTAVPLGEHVLDGFASLDGLPVLCCSRHSQLAPACAGLGGGRIAYVQLGGGALAVSFSDTVRALRERGAIEAAVAVSPCIDGDVQCLTVAGALAWAKVGGFAAVVCGPGPGGGRVGPVPSPGVLAAASAANAASALGGRPIVAPCVSLAGSAAERASLTEETRETLRLCVEPAVVAWPVGLPPPTGLNTVAVDVEGWDVACVGLPLLHDGRGPDDDPWFFKAAYAAGRVVDWNLA